MGKNAKSVKAVKKELFQGSGAITHLYKVFSNQTEVIPVDHSEKLGIAAAVYIGVSAIFQSNRQLRVNAVIPQWSVAVYECLMSFM